MDVICYSARRVVCDGATGGRNKDTDVVVVVSAREGVGVGVGANVRVRGRRERADRRPGLAVHAGDDRRRRVRESIKVSRVGRHRQSRGRLGDEAGDRGNGFGVCSPTRNGDVPGISRPAIHGGGGRQAHIHLGAGQRAAGRDGQAGGVARATAEGHFIAGRWRNRQIAGEPAAGNTEARRRSRGRAIGGAHRE